MKRFKNMNCYRLIKLTYIGDSCASFYLNSIHSCGFSSIKKPYKSFHDVEYPYVKIEDVFPPKLSIAEAAKT